MEMRTQRFPGYGVDSTGAILRHPTFDLSDPSFLNLGSGGLLFLETLQQKAG
ncbi:MAG TPA: hypothetical protein VIL33_02900 [Rhodothermia bacterium]